VSSTPSSARRASSSTGPPARSPKRRQGRFQATTPATRPPWAGRKRRERRRPATRNQTTCRRIPEWRDPDSNRGHHDFQSCASVSRTGRKLLHISGIQQRSGECAKPANSILSWAIRETEGVPSPDAARVRPTNPHQRSVASDGEIERGTGVVVRAPWARIYNSGRGARALVPQAHARHCRARLRARGAARSGSHLTDLSSAVRGAAATRPSHVRDAKPSTSWVRSRRSEHGIGPRRFPISGLSSKAAGGLLGADRRR
jgi:hypothetical protein